MKTSIASLALASPAAAAASISRRSQPAPREPFQPRLVRQDLEHLVEALAGLSQDHRQREDVKIAHPVVMRQAGLRAHAQAARDRLAISHRRKATSFRPGGTRSI